MKKKVKITAIFKEVMKLAQKSLLKNEVPVGAVIVDANDQIVAKGFNHKESKNNVLDHAEIIAIKKLAKKVKSWKLDTYTLYSSLEPCHLCQEVIKVSRIKKVIYFAKQTKKVNYKTKWEFVSNKEASAIMTKYFKNKK